MAVPPAASCFFAASLAHVHVSASCPESLLNDESVPVLGSIMTVLLFSLEFLWQLSSLSFDTSIFVTLSFKTFHSYKFIIVSFLTLVILKWIMDFHSFLLHSSSVLWLLFCFVFCFFLISLASYYIWAYIFLFSFETVCYLCWPWTPRSVSLPNSWDYEPNYFPALLELMFFILHTIAVTDVRLIEYCKFLS